MARLRELCRVGRKLLFDFSSVSVDTVLNKLLLFTIIYEFKFDFYLKLEDKKKMETFLLRRQE